MNPTIILTLCVLAGLLLIWVVIPKVAKEISAIRQLTRGEDRHFENHGDGL